RPGTSATHRAMEVDSSRRPRRGAGRRGGRMKTSRPATVIASLRTVSRAGGLRDPKQGQPQSRPRTIHGGPNMNIAHFPQPDKSFPSMRQKREQAIAAAIALLAETFSKCFSVYQE